MALSRARDTRCREEQVITAYPSSTFGAGVIKVMGQLCHRKAKPKGGHPNVTSWQRIEDQTLAPRLQLQRRGIGREGAELRDAGAAFARAAFKAAIEEKVASGRNLMSRVK